MILTTVVAAIVLGIAAQILAERTKVPAILPLLAAGILAGPELWSMLGVHVAPLVDPEAMGGGLEVLIHLGIALILFEGGLSLDPRQLRRVGGAVRNLLSVGIAVTAVGAAWLFHVLLSMPWSTSALFGAIVTVTGPTVIAPLLRHMIVPRPVATVLVSEGLIIDPIGAVLAYLVLQTIDRPGVPMGVLGRELAWLVVIGAVVGFAAGSAAKLVIGSRRTGDDIRNLTILAILLFAYVVAEHQAPQSGILAAVVMGFTMSAADIPDLVRLREFKGQLTVLLISVLFVLLAAQLDLRTLDDLGWRGLVVVGGLILLVRPLAVALSIPGRELDLAGRSVVALTAPRGIVAAAVASLASRQLRQAGVAGASALEGMVYLTILVTGVWATGMSIVLPRVLGYARDPKRRLTVLVGAHALSEALAGVLLDEGRAVTVLDSAPGKLARLSERGVGAVRGDAQDAASFERAGVQRDTQVVALTTNDELNLLVAELVRDELGVEHPAVALDQPSEEFGRVRRAWVDLVGGRPLDLGLWIRRFEAGQALLATVGLSEPKALEALRLQMGFPLGPSSGPDGEEGDEDRVVPLIAWSDGAPSFRLDSRDTEAFRAFERLTVMVAGRHVPEALAPFVVRAGGAEDDAGGGGAS